MLLKRCVNLTKEQVEALKVIGQAKGGVSVNALVRMAVNNLIKREMAKR